jgi:hypothetical protein
VLPLAFEVAGEVVQVGGQQLLAVLFVRVEQPNVAAFKLRRELHLQRLRGRLVRVGFPL